MSAMGDTKQLTILKALTTLLEGITTANGYDFDLAGRVYRGKGQFGSQEELPFVSILESLRPDPEPLEAGYEKMIRQEEWELLIQGWVTANVDLPTDALYNLKGAVEQRLSRVVAVTDLHNPQFPEDYRLGGLLTGIRIGPGVVRAATPQVGGVEAFYLPVLVCYVMNVADPWALT